MFNTNRGVRWQKWSDRTMQNAAEWGACEDMPGESLETVWKEHDGTVLVCFGSTPANVTYGLIDQEVRHLFLHGYCTMFAFALAQRLGINDVVFLTSGNAEPGNWKGHVGVPLPDGRVVDIDGPQDAAQFGKGVLDTVVSSEQIPVDEMIRRVWAPEFVHDPLTFVDPMEQFLLWSWVEAVITEHGLG